MNNCPSSMWLPTVMNKNTYIGERTESNALYAVPPPPKQQVVISCNLVADGVLWISPTTNAGKTNAQSNRSMAWIVENHWCRTSDQGNLSHYLHSGLVLPIWCPQNSLVVMGGGGLIPRKHDSLDRPEIGPVECADRKCSSKAC